MSQTRKAVASPQRNPGVSQQQDKETPAARLGREREHLGVSEVDVVAALGSGQPQAVGRVGPDTPASGCVIERGRHDEDRLPDAGRAKSGGREAGDPLGQPVEGVSSFT